MLLIFCEGTGEDGDISSDSSESVCAVAGRPSLAFFLTGLLWTPQLTPNMPLTLYDSVSSSLVNRVDCPTNMAANSACRERTSRVCL